MTVGWYSQVLRSGDTARRDGQVVQSGVTVRWYSQVWRSGATVRCDGQVLQSGVVVGCDGRV